jgi:hypothetical protein
MKIRGNTMKARILLALALPAVLVSVALGVYIQVPNGTTSYSIYPTVKDKTATVPGDFNNAPIVTNQTLYWVTPDGNSEQSVGLTALATYSTAWSSGKAVTSGHAGVERICVPDACLRAGIGKKCVLYVVSSSGDDVVEKYTIVLSNIDPNGNTLSKVQNVSTGANLASTSDLSTYGYRDPNQALIYAIVNSGTYGNAALLTAINAISTAAFGGMASGTAQAGTATTITLANATSSAADLVGMLVYTTGGTGPSQCKQITAYNASTKVATVDTPWKTNPASNTTYVVAPNAATILAKILGKR